MNAKHRFADIHVASSTEPIEIMHIITGLSTGGAETMLYKLFSGIDKSRFQCRVVSLTDKGPLTNQIKDLGIPVTALNMPRGIPAPKGLWKLIRLIRRGRPAIVQTWMYHSDLIGAIAGRIGSRAPIIWNIRHSNLDPRANKKTTILTARACALFSGRLPEKIICCSESSRRIHAGIGYEKSKMTVIPNGFNLEAFRPDKEARLSVRKELGISKDALLLGMVARFDPQKDHATFVRAAKTLTDWGTKAYFLLCGKDVDRDNPMLCKWIRDAGLSERFFLLGPRTDIPRLTVALDLACLSSAFGEGFPNILGEAMACEVPCVATDTGDSAAIVGDTGRIVPPKDPHAFAGACKELLDSDFETRAQLGFKARKRIEKHFELSKIINKYEALYQEIMTERPKTGF
ncbi:MAG: glycosyltransferase [Desulfobacteraceae bacterium]|nr:glycosyltransferase [Desulfobacteraceae bacterium]